MGQRIFSTIWDARRQTQFLNALERKNYRAARNALETMPDIERHYYAPSQDQQENDRSKVLLEGYRALTRAMIAEYGRRSRPTKPSKRR